MRNRAAIVLILLASATAAFAAAEGFTLLKTVPVPGEGGWDYLIVDDAGRRVYISHSTQVDVMDADSYEIKGTIKDEAIKGVHGIAVAPDLGRGYISNGGSNTVTVFDLKTLKPIGDPVKTGNNPDCIIYDPSTKRVFAFNGRGKSATVIEAGDKDSKVAGTIELGGKPEFAAADGAGKVFVNLEDKDEVLKLDAKKMEVLDHIKIDPGKTPVGMAMDTKKNRLFVGCGNQKLVVINAENGKVIDNQPIGKGVDATAFDPETNNIFNSCADGTVTVVHQEGDKYTVVETIKTKERSKTMAVDRKTHKLFLPSADFKPAAAGGRPTIDPKTFAILVFGKSEK
jgi:DNA-binding beta-propeller fold protein YncE